MVLARYRFRPRFRGVAASAALVGAALWIAAVGFGLSGPSLVFALVAGSVGVALGGLYLASPAWRLEVTVDDEAIEVLAAGDRRFRLPWEEIERVVASSDTKTCFVDGGSPDRSLLLPGPGASAPYEIEHRDALFDTIIAKAPPAVVEEVPYLRDAARKRAGDAGPEGEPAEPADEATDRPSAESRAPEPGDDDREVPR